MKLLITIDVELSSHPHTIGITGHINGRRYGIHRIMDILEQYQAKGIFFVDVYGYVRSGKTFMEQICCEIQERGHELALHTHPNNYYGEKKSKMTDLSYSEQERFIREGKDIIFEWTGVEVISHRAGNWAANEDTLKALDVNGFLYDFSAFYGYPCCKLSPSRKYGVSANSLREIPPSIFEMAGVGIFKKYQIADVNSCMFTELKLHLRKAQKVSNLFVLVLHSFSFLGWNNTSFFNIKRRTKYWPKESYINTFSRFLSYAQENNCEISTSHIVGSLIQDSNLTLKLPDALIVQKVAWRTGHLVYDCIKFSSLLLKECLT